MRTPGVLELVEIQRAENPERFRVQPRRSAAKFGVAIGSALFQAAALKKFLKSFPAPPAIGCRRRIDKTTRILVTRKTTKRRLQKPEVRREQMISAAQDCMREKGLYATNVTEIAKRAGVSVGLLYHIFPNKEALIEVMMRANVEASLEQVNAQLPSSVSNLYDYLAITSTPVDSLTLETLAEQSRHQKSGGKLSGIQNEAFARVRDTASALLPDNGAPDLDLRIRLITTINFGVGTLLATGGTEGHDRVVEAFEAISRAIADRSTIDFGTLFSE